MPAYSGICTDTSIDFDPSFGLLKLEYLISLVVVLMWMKCILLLRVTKTFGPMLKIIQVMIVDLI